MTTMRELFPHPESSFHQVVSPDSEFSGDQGEEGVEIYEGESVEILSWMIATEGYWESFDFVLIDREVPAVVFLTRACQAWVLLKPGGLMGLTGFEENEDEDKVCGLIDTFGKSLGDRISVVLRGKTCVFLK